MDYTRADQKNQSKKLTTYLFLAQTFHNLQQLDKAIFYYENSLKFDMNNVNVLNKIGYLYYLTEDYRKAISHLHKALELNPNNFASHYYMGLVYKELNQATKSIHHLEKAYDLNPNNHQAAYHLAGIHIEQNHIDEAVKWYDIVSKLPCQHQPDALYMLACLKKSSAMKKAPAQYIKNLFDAYASNYEENLIDNLEYRAPRVLAEMLENLNDNNLYSRCLDLGCGTGLAGEVLKKFCHSIDGVDLAEKMLEKAKSKKIYDSLNCSEILLYLRNYKSLYDLIVSADVLNYFGDLSQLFGLASQALIDSGKFLFTVEKQSKGLYSLQNNGRFSHSSEYIYELAKLNYFDLVDERETPIRTENKAPILGKAYLLQKLAVHRQERP